MDLDGRNALVTGAGAGIGLGIARSLARAGARLTLTDLDPGTLAAAATELAATTDVVSHVLDVRDRGRFAEVVDAAESELGPVDVLCNNAGVAVPESAEAMSYELWDLLLGVDLGGVVNGLQTVLPGMIRRGRPAHVVNTASVAGVVPAAGYAYTAAKHAVVGLSESLGARLHDEGHPIGVTVLCPGAVATELARTSHRVLDAETSAGAALAERMAVLGSVLARHGADPDRVGDLTTAAIRDGRRHVFTDRSGADLLVERFRALLDALPGHDAAGGSAADFLGEVRQRRAGAQEASR